MWFESKFNVTFPYGAGWNKIPINLSRVCVYGIKLQVKDGCNTVLNGDVKIVPKNSRNVPYVSSVARTS